MRAGGAGDPALLESDARHRGLLAQPAHQTAVAAAVIEPTRLRGQVALRGNDAALRPPIQTGAPLHPGAPTRTRSPEAGPLPFPDSTPRRRCPRPCPGRQRSRIRSLGTAANERDARGCGPSFTRGYGRRAANAAGFAGGVHAALARARRLGSVRHKAAVTIGNITTMVIGDQNSCCINAAASGNPARR